MTVLGPNLATCQLAAWAENAVKSELSNKNGRKKTNKSEVGVEWEMNMSIFICKHRK